MSEIRFKRVEYYTVKLVLHHIFLFDSRTGHHTTKLPNGFAEPFGSVSFCTDFGLGLYLVFILNLWSLSREFGFFAALLFFFVKDKCIGDCLARPCLCFLEHMTVDVRCR